MARKKFICKLAEIAPDTLKQVDLSAEHKICVISAGGELFACQAYCPHQGIALCEGVLEGTTLTCLEHLWQWDLRSGEPMGKAEEPLKMIAVHADGDSIYLDD